MFRKNLRITLGIISFLIGGIFIYCSQLAVGVILLLGALFLIYGHFRYGTVWKAFQSIKRNNIAKAKEELSQITKPDLLSKSQKGYYYWAMGLIGLQENDLETAKEQLKKAIDVGVRTENDLSLIKLTLAEIHYTKGQLQEADTRLNEVKNTPHKNGINEHIKELEKKLNGKQEE